MKIKHIGWFLVALVVIVVVAVFVSQKWAHAPIDLATARPVAYSGGATVDMIEVTTPLPGTAISSPLVISGFARGPWYFEASFPVTLTDGDGLIIAEGPAQAQGEWMTTDRVPFTISLNFAVPANADAFGRRGTLILKNDNPSGDPARDMAVEIPVLFK
ncbi:MAG: Gmad2 immunoglobulin-like domain-containing protein [Patescibacteria group bacterium]